MDDTIATTLTFADSNLQTYSFEFHSVESSEPYRECQLGASEEAEVLCILSNRIRYSSEELGFDFISFYEQSEMLEGAPNFEQCLYRIEFPETESQGHLITRPIYVESDRLDQFYLELIDTFEIADITYQNVALFTIDEMMTFDTYRQDTPDFVEPSHVSEVILQIPNGIVGLTLEDRTQLILEQ